MNSRRIPWLGFAILLFARSSPPARAADSAFYEMRIRPLFADKCYRCHGPEHENRKGALRLDQPYDRLPAGEHGPAIEPGHPERSRIIEVAQGAGRQVLNHPPLNPALTVRELNDVKQWIVTFHPVTPPHATLGSKLEGWPFLPVARTAPPEVHNRTWIRSPIDSFILAALENRALAPASSASKRVLLRRATYDLIGLPPTPEEIDNFLRDTSDEAFPRVVDRLLASPLYGQRWARHWLDLVRYTDSFDARGIGGAGDVPESYRYRDWVVEALNQDMPYDDFIRWQVAGDIIATEGSRFKTNALIATGVYALGEWGIGDADKEKMLTDIVDDQVDLTSRAFLGLTVACARCHDHKFDPISTRDYYALGGMFFSSHILPGPGKKTEGSPVLRIPLASSASIAAREQCQKKIEVSRHELNETLDRSILDAGSNAIPHVAEAIVDAWQFSETGKTQKPLSTAWARFLGWKNAGTLDKLIENSGGKKNVISWQTFSRPNPSATLNLSKEQVTIATLTLPPRSVAVHPAPDGPVAVEWNSPVNGSVTISGELKDADDKCGDGVEWLVQHFRGENRTAIFIASGAITNGGSASFGGHAPLLVTNVATGDTILFSILPKGGYECDTTVVDLTVKSIERGDRWNLTEDTLASLPQTDLQPAESSLWRFLDPAAPKQRARRFVGTALVPLLSATNIASITAEAQNVQRTITSLASAAARGQAITNEPDYTVFRELTNAHGEFWAASRTSLAGLPPTQQKRIADLRATLQHEVQSLAGEFSLTHGLQEGGTPGTSYEGFHDAHVLRRGRYDRPAAEVPRGIPEVLAKVHPLGPIRAGSGRRELADWIASTNNPLTARVMVNRIWQHHFGEGLVRTANNFGKLGFPPSHPELLDFLARRFMEGGWSIKQMHRLIMLSSTYQQSSSASAEVLKADPENLLLARMPRRRLESEAIRDTLLRFSTLDCSTAGPATRDFNSNRRTLYLMTVRSDRATYQTLFDAADAGALSEKRNETTVAPQALFFLNHPFVLNQARALAQHVIERPAGLQPRLAFLYELLYARPPLPEEIKVAQGLISSGQSVYAWQRYCQALLCANEFIYVD